MIRHLETCGHSNDLSRRDLSRDLWEQPHKFEGIQAFLLYCAKDMPGDDQRYSKWVAERFTWYSTCMWFAIARPSFLIEKNLLFHGAHWETETFTRIWIEGKGWLWELWQQILDVEHVRFQIPLFVFWLRTGQTTRMPVSFSVYCDIHKFHAMPIPAMLLGNLARSFPLQVLAHAMVNATLFLWGGKLTAIDFQRDLDR